jgi:hypothetical protein
MRWTWEAVVFSAMIVGAFGGLIYAWTQWRADAHKAELPRWRQIGAAIGFVAVTLQAALFIAFWTWPHIRPGYAFVGRWARWVLPTFLVALPFVLAGKGRARLWLLSSSVVLFVICFFMALSV